MRRLSRALVLGLLCAGALLFPRDTEGGQACNAVTIGIDPSEGLNSAEVFDPLGDLTGQTFYASDTLLRSLSVWRVASQDTNIWGLRLFIVKADSAGRPMQDSVVFVGPELFVDGDGDFDTPTEFKWVFDPPVALPHRGRFTFLVRVAPCVFWGYVDMLATDHLDLYPGGCLWLLTRGATCLVGGSRRSNCRADMIFRIEFCRDSTTPVQRDTWGKLKSKFRR